MVPGWVNLLLRLDQYNLGCDGCRDGLKLDSLMPIYDRLMGMPGWSGGNVARTPFTYSYS